MKKKSVHSPPFILHLGLLKGVALTSPKHIGHHLILGGGTRVIVDQYVTVRHGRGFRVNLHKLEAVLGKYSFGDHVDLFSVAGASEQYQVLSISADIRVVFAFGEHVLHQ